MNKKISIYLVLLLTTLGSINAQEHFSTYMLGDYVAQTQNLSPVYLPKNSFTFGLPGVGLGMKSGLKLNDLIVPGATSNRIDFDNLLSVAQDVNNINGGTDLSVFMLAFKTKKGSFTIFANVRNSLNWQFSDDFVGVAANGIDSFSLTDDKMSLTSFSEIGLGFTRKFFNDKLAIGLRLKSLNGIAHGSTAENSSLSLDIDPNTSYWTVVASNATLNTSGPHNIPDNDEFAPMTGNTGFAFDIGATYNVNDKLSFEIAVNDIGSIDWTEYVTNYNIDDTTGSVYTGVNLDATSIDDEIEDALNNVIGTSETSESFKTKLTMRTYASAKYQLSQKNALTAAYFSSKNELFDTKPSYALGFNRTLNKTTYGIVASGGGLNEDFRFGANVVFRLGFLQLYAAADNISNLFGKVEDTNGGNVRVGLNLVFGYNKWIKKREAEAETNAEALETLENEDNSIDE